MAMLTFFLRFVAVLALVYAMIGWLLFGDDIRRWLP